MAGKDVVKDKKDRKDRKDKKDTIVQTAARLFYQSGYRAIGVDTLAAAAGTGKMTLYRHFASKDDLIVAYLQASHRIFWSNFNKVTQAQTSPHDKLLAFFEALQEYATSGECYGCPFLNVATEYPEPDYPGHQIAFEHKQSVRARFRQLAAEAGARQPEQLADGLCMLMDGAYMAARLFGASAHNPAAHLAETARNLIDAQCAAAHVPSYSDTGPKTTSQRKVIKDAKQRKEPQRQNTDEGGNCEDTCGYLCVLEPNVNAEGENLMTDGLAKKLMLKPGMDVLVINAPAGYVAQLRAAFPEGEVHDMVERPGGKGHFDCVHLFVRDSGELESFYNTAHAAMRADSLFWISYPKQSSGIKSDLNRDTLHVRIISDGWQGVRQVALDDTWSAMRYKRPDVATPSDAVAAQYSGPKADLRPIYNYVVEIVQSLGDDVKITPRASYVAFARKSQFAAIAAPARDRVDLALKLKGRPFDDFVQENTGIGSAALTHKVSLRSTMDVNDVVVALLSAAYAGAA